MLNKLKNFNKKMIFPGIFLMIVWLNFSSCLILTKNHSFRSGTNYYVGRLLFMQAMK
jgi:hypothetical protein